MKKEIKRPQKDWVTISNLEKEVHYETVDNKKRFVRSLSRTVRYLQVSAMWGKFLCEKHKQNKITAMLQLLTGNMLVFLFGSLQNIQ